MVLLLYNCVVHNNRLDYNFLYLLMFCSLCSFYFVCVIIFTVTLIMMQLFYEMYTFILRHS